MLSAKKVSGSIGLKDKRLKKYMYSLGKNNINTCGSLKISQKLLG
jgi:hypothetical protein